MFYFFLLQINNKQKVTKSLVSIKMLTPKAHKKVLRLRSYFISSKENL